MKILKEKEELIIEHPWMQKLELKDNSRELLQAVSDELFDGKSFHISHISKETFEFYGEIGSIEEYIDKFYSGNKEELIKIINDFRDMNGVPLSIGNREFYVIASDEELKLIYDNQIKPVIPSCTIIPEDYFAYDD